MGIQGLLPFLKNCVQPASIKQYRGCTVAIDSYCWLHKGAFSCADKLAAGKETDQYVYYCLKFVNMLLSYDVKPIMVFDGCRLPSKRDVEKQRRERREVYRKKGMQLLREGKQAEARDCFTKCVDITSQMALELMKACRDKGVDCIVAPYEADAQLAYLSKTGIAQLIITEDSDLLLFGCEKVMFKMDTSGNGMLVCKEDLPKAMELNADHYTFDKFRYMCILSGCDYLSSISGIGLKKAQKLWQRTRQTDIRLVLKKLPTILNMNVTVTEEYIEGFVRANNTFLYQLVFDPTKRKLLPLNPYPEDIDIRDLNYAGPPLSQQHAFQIALGNIDIYSNERICDFDPDSFQPKYKKKRDKDLLHHLSIWDSNYRPMPKMGNIKQLNDVERPNIKAKTTIVKIDLPLKRRRTDEGPSDGELASLYGSENTHEPKDDNSPSPCKKRKLLVESNTPDALNFNDDCKVIIEKPVQKVHSKNPFAKQNACLKQIDTDVESDENKLKVSDTRNEQNRVDVNTLKSPSKNVFRITGPTKKDKFSLNLKKEVVVSRFFKNEKPLEKTAFFTKMESEYEKPTEKKKPVWEENESSSEDEPLGQQTEDSNQEENLTASASVLDLVNQSSKSAYGLFSSNKLSHFKSKFDSKQNLLQSSPASYSQFKSVLNKTSSSASIDKLKQDSQQSVESCNDISSCDVSQKTNLCSIDTESFDLSLGTSDHEESMNTSQTSSSTKQNSQVSEASISGYFNTSSKLSPSSQPSNPKTVNKLGCRQTGLSKKGKSTKGAKENQTLDKFFSLAAFKRNDSNAEKLARIKKPLSPQNK